MRAPEDIMADLLRFIGIHEGVYDEHFDEIQEIEEEAREFIKSQRGDTYLIRRFVQEEGHPEHLKVIKTGLTLEEAQAHCQREDTHGDGWFDGYDKEN